MESNYSLSDLAAVTGEKNECFGGNGWWIILLFLFIMNGGFGWGNNQGLTQAQMQQGFDTQEITRKLDGLANGLCDGFYAQNTTMLTGLANVNATVNQARADAQQCCCETNRNIDAVRYENAKNTCDVITAGNENTQKILDAITCNRMADMQNQINQLQLQAALCSPRRRISRGAEEPPLPRIRAEREHRGREQHPARGSGMKMCLVKEDNFWTELN